MGVKVFNVLIGLFIGGIGALYEYLRMTFDSSTKNLIVECKAEEALKKVEKVEKADIFKGYKTSCQLEKMLCYIDLREFEKLEAYVDELDQSDNIDYDVTLISKYAKMISYGERGMKNKSKEAYKQLISVRDFTNKKGKRKKGSYYLNWDVVNGQHKNYDEEYQNAWKYLAKIDEANMNQREVAQYLAAKALSAKKLNRERDYEECLERIDKLVGSNQALKEHVHNL